MARFISFNVNGIRAIVKKDFKRDFLELDADIFAIQESKCQAGQIELAPEGYKQYWNYAEKKGYSGTAAFTKKEPISVSYGLNIPEHDTEGRVITLEFDDYYFVTVYTPNSQDGLKRLPYRMEWDDAFRAYMVELDQKKPVVICGDLNVAHNEIDLKNPDTNHLSAGFSDEERAQFTKLLDAGFIDTWRHFNPDVEDRYSWWSYRTRARERNAGWRIDYFLVSDRLIDRVTRVDILDQIYGSDHCPVLLEMADA